MSIRTRVWKLLGKFDRRLTLVESAVERIEGAVDDMLAIATELKAMAANLNAAVTRLEAAVPRLEAAVTEQGRTLGSMLDTVQDERERRAGIGREQMAQSGRLDYLERKLGIGSGA
jgi:hypothetical protein